MDRAKVHRGRPSVGNSITVLAIAGLVVFPPACESGEAEGTAEADLAPSFRDGPAPGTVAAEVAALRAMPLQLSPSAAVGALPGAGAVDPSSPPPRAFSWS